ncbi:MAG: hypothetical protein IT580_12650 [Verrucomicrobiales bacterium]|nr:hypothetical protein [Verrucomicrobiales bacterium]
MKHQNPNRAPGSGEVRTAVSPRILAVAILAAAWLTRSALGAEPLFQEDFSQVAPGQVPESFLVIDGQFAVQEEEGNRFLELPGAPLESFGVMFGPAAKEDRSVRARFHGTGQGRRFPVFGVSLNGIAGYRLQVSPAKKSVELLKGDTVQATAPFSWESGTWTQLRIQIRKVGAAAWVVEGKAWKGGNPEPAAWTVSWNEPEAPIAGRSAVWGKPFSGTPIRFDDLRVSEASTP